MELFKELKISCADAFLPNFPSGQLDDISDNTDESFLPNVRICFAQNPKLL